MTKLHMLVKVSYADFDIRQDTPIAVSEDRKKLQDMAAEKNARLTKEDIRNEIRYEVSQTSVKLV